MSTLSFREFMDYAERLLGEAGEKDGPAANPYLIGSFLTAWMSLESFVNNRMEDFAQLPEGKLTLHELGFLKEKQVKFEKDGARKGTFVITAGDEYKPIDHKILFLIARFGKTGTLGASQQLWERFSAVRNTRNSLVHPRRSRQRALSESDARQAIGVVKDVIDWVGKEVWRKPVEW